jgi:phosphoribosylaminoimidazole-succinocarboxamide synthase
MVADSAMPLPSHLPLDRLGAPFYVGSVQRLFPIPEDDRYMATETTGRGSVFDVGSIFEIPGSGVSRAVFRHVLYSRLGRAEFWNEVRETLRRAPDLDPEYRDALLSGPALAGFCREGAPTHHEGMIDALTGAIVRDGLPAHPSAVNVVRRYRIEKPRPVRLLGRPCYDYSAFPGLDGHVVPLEFIVRFGITDASSVLRKYRALDEAGRRAYEAELGADGPLVPWTLSRRPITDCTTKHEPEDRAVSLQEAFALSGLDADRFGRALESAALGAWAVRHLLEPAGLLLWDLKWEFARDGDRIVFVDTIDTDSIRATLFLDEDGRRVVIHVNKQAMRDYYRIMHPEWMEAVNAAKAEARHAGVPFPERLAAGQREGRWPRTPVVPGEFLAVQARKLDVIRDRLLDRISPSEARDALGDAGRAELAHYRGAGKIGDFLRINAIG